MKNKSKLNGTELTKLLSVAGLNRRASAKFDGLILLEVRWQRGGCDR